MAAAQQGLHGLDVVEGGGEAQGRPAACHGRCAAPCAATFAAAGGRLDVERLGSALDGGSDLGVLEEGGNVAAFEDGVHDAHQEVAVAWGSSASRHVAGGGLAGGGGTDGGLLRRRQALGAVLGGHLSGL